MASEWMDWGFVTWKPNTNQQVQLQDGSILVTMLDADYPAIGTTKNLSGIAKCESRSESFVGWVANLSGTMACQSTGTMVKLTTGKEEVSASISCEVSAIRLAFQGANNVLQTPGKVSPSIIPPQLFGSMVGVATDNNGDHIYVTTASDGSSIALYRVNYNTGLTSSTTIATSGTAWGAVTLTTAHILDATGQAHRGHVAVDSAGVVHVAWSFFTTFTTGGAFYWRSDTAEKVYLNTPASAAVPVRGPIAILCQSSTTIHIIYASYLRSGGKDYIMPAVISRTGTTWTAAVRSAGTAWNAGNAWTLLAFRAYYIDATDRTKVYLQFRFADAAGISNFEHLIWVNLTARTFSTTPLISGSAVIGYSSLRTYYGGVIDPLSYGDFSMHFEGISANTWLERRAVYTLATWTAPTLTVSVSTYGGSGDGIWSLIRVNGTTYLTIYEAYYVASFSACRVYFRNASTYGGALTYYGQILGVEVNGATSAWIRVSDMYSSDQFSHTTVMSNSTTHSVDVIKWAARTYDVHLDGTLAGAGAATLNLNVLTDTVAVELDGLLQGVSTATLDLLVGDTQYLEASLAALVTVFLELRTTNAVLVDAILASEASATLNLYTGKTFLDALLESDHRVYLNLDHVRNIELALDAATAQASASMDTVIRRRLAASIAAEASASLEPNYAVRLSSSAEAVAVAALTLELNKRLQAAVTSTATAVLGVQRVSPVKAEGVPVYTKDAPSFVATSGSTTWVKTRK